ncbi:MAG: AraC family transcriptional regulator, partial [Thermoanaerobaculia bacterium]|nr:AraC family transcriptional regulator [Thermoanaerobaculia bacterium]
ADAIDALAPAGPIDVDFSDSPGMRAAFLCLQDEQSDDRPGADAMTTALMSQCFIMFLRRLAEEGGTLPWLDAVVDEQLGRAIDVVLADPGGHHSVDSLAEVAGMSRSTFTDHFRKAFERSPMDFVRETRLQAGARLLRSSELPIKQVARRVGLQSRSNFSRAFTEYYGMPPKRYRMGALLA